MYHIPKRILGSLCKQKKIKFRGEPLDKLINELEKAGLTDTLQYFDKEFRFAEGTKALTMCKPERIFPNSSANAEKFIEKLIQEKKILREQVGTFWEPEYTSEIKLCGIIQDGADVFIRMVEEKYTNRKRGWKSAREPYAYVTSAVIHFSEQLVELRCSYYVRHHYLEFIMDLLGFPNKMQKEEWAWLTSVTKEEAKRISELLSAKLSSSHIAIPSTVGSMRLEGIKDVDLREDKTFNEILNLINSQLKLSTDDTLDETCTLKFTDPVGQVDFDVVFEINILSGGFKFVSGLVSEKVIDQILDAFIIVYVERNKKKKAQGYVDTTQERITAGEQILEGSV
ncbi:hypothetical protein SPSYN_00909 [Sporotomaculum syntrophicum]|uniref:Uncharacterized protein n=1 Tax=Sporotomaculum syntrophicum TaxID=182264 RepID=A0A9D2WRS5_9FIRM|nr:hypothetical protein [Sporotomaculum syntrophicum]KAF1086168.1 hypothetical protein SPSYN_00909 [Sporotomaculum syntrophicum]